MSVTVSASKTTLARNAVGNQILRQAAQTYPTALYLALFTADPTDAGSLANEVSGNGYARQPIAFAAPTTAGGGQQWANSALISFPAATANWPSPVVYGALMDALTGGNMWYKGAWSASITISNGQQFQLASGGLAIVEV